MRKPTVRTAALIVAGAGLLAFGGVSTALASDQPAEAPAPVTEPVPSSGKTEPGPKPTPSEGINVVKTPDGIQISKAEGEIPPGESHPTRPEPAGK